MQESSQMSESYRTISERKPSSEQTSNCTYPLTEPQQELTMMQKATLIVDTVTNMLCKEITKGKLFVDDQEKQLPIQKPIEVLTRNQAILAKLQEVDEEEHRRKVKTLMELNRKMKLKRSQRARQFENSLKKSEEEQQKMKQQQREKELTRRKSLIESRLADKAELMARIRQMSIESDERVKNVKSKKFLYEQKEQEFKEKFLLPKIEQEKKVLERRKDKMKSMDMNQLFQHQKNYKLRRETNSINRSMTSRFIQSQNAYNPPEYVPKSYLLYAAEQNMKKQEQMLKIKQAQINKSKVKEFVKNITEIHKLQKQISKSRSKSPQQKSVQESPSKDQKKKKKTKKQKKNQLSKEELTNVGNQYFKALLLQIRANRQKQRLKQKQKQQLDKSNPKINQNAQDDLQIQIRSEQVRTVQKIERIERSYKIRSRKIESIFNDQTIDPVLKYEKLKHQVQNLDMALKTKNLQSEDLKERTQAAGNYMTAIKAKIKLLQVTSKN